MKKRMVSGIKPTGGLTLGNYIGAIQNFVKLQDNHEMYIFVADLHALTTEKNKDAIKKNKRLIVATYLAAGLNPEKCVIFNQSDVLEHANLGWILENQTSIGELSRMTQFKDKSQGDNKQSNGTNYICTGLLTYPALMAADILLYDANYVPVGKDQKQHIELTRNIAERFNNFYGQTFVIPEPLISETGAKIMSLTDPTKKMSKTDNQSKSFISLFENPQEAVKKILKAVTDSEGKVYISEDKPGILNLLTIFASLKSLTLIEAETHFKDANYGEFKKEVAAVVEHFLTDLQSKIALFEPIIDQILSEGQRKASSIASQKLREVKIRNGLL